MSKAFTRESDDDATDAPLRPIPSLPSGAKNYLTPGGEQALRAELQELTSRRTQLDKGSADARRPLDHRIAHIQQSLQSAVVVPPPPEPWTRVLFGSSVTVRNSRGEVDSYRIVGVDEIDLDRAWVSFLSPIARALLNAELGSKVRFRFPSGEEQLEIIEIRYESI